MVAWRYEISLLVLKRKFHEWAQRTSEILFNTRRKILFIIQTPHVKKSSFRAKAHLVFHWCLYNNVKYYFPFNEMNKNDLPARRFTVFFFGLYCVITVTPFIERSVKGVTVVTLRYLIEFADLSNIFFIQSLLFSTAACNAIPARSRVTYGI